MAPQFESNPSCARLCTIGEADPFLAQLLRRFARECGLRAFNAQTGEALLELIAQGRPDLIILDPELPGNVRGWDAYQQIKMNSDTRTVPMIICSWLKEDETRALVEQAAVHLQKPDLHFEDFTAALGALGLQVAADGSNSHG